MIDQATIDKILDSANIVEVVSDFVTLRKRGVNYIGLCPFHDEKNALVQRISLKKHMQMFQLRKRWQRRPLYYGTRTNVVLRSTEISGQEIQH